MYGQFNNLPWLIKNAKDLKLNTIRVVNMFRMPYTGDPDTAARDEKSWRKADAAIAALGQAGLHATLDLSDYRNFLLAAGQNPYTKDWKAYLKFVADRVNTVSGVRYAADPTIALVAFAGEVDVPSGSVTTQQITDFYRRTFSEWKQLDPNHLTTSGGLSYLNWNSGIDWRAIMGLAQGDVCSIHAYSDGDLSVTTPNVAHYCGGLNKPWLTEEFGVCRSTFFSDAVRAARAQHVYDVQRQYHSAGAIFWNLGPETNGHTCDINASFPQTFAVVRNYAPR